MVGADTAIDVCFLNQICDNKSICSAFMRRCSDYFWESANRKQYNLQISVADQDPKDLHHLTGSGSEIISMDLDLNLAFLNCLQYTKV